MEIVRHRISNSLLHKHLIIDIPESPKSYSSLILLNRHYRRIDLGFDKKDWRAWRYLFIVKRTFLRHIKKDGKWDCHYCRKVLYKLPVRGTNKQEWNEIVTVDHVTPACQVEDKTDSSNFVACCAQCNKEKGSMSYEEFTTTRYTKDKFRIPRENDLITLYK